MKECSPMTGKENPSTPQVTRYSLCYSGNSEWPIEEDPEGGLVDYEEHIKALDHAKEQTFKAEARISQLEEALREARESIKEWAYFAQSCGGYISISDLQAELDGIDAVLSGHLYE